MYKVNTREMSRYELLTWMVTISDATKDAIPFLEEAVLQRHPEKRMPVNLKYVPPYKSGEKYMPGTFWDIDGVHTPWYAIPQTKLRGYRDIFDNSPMLDCKWFTKCRFLDKENVWGVRLTVPEEVKIFVNSAPTDLVGYCKPIKRPEEYIVKKEDIKIVITRFDDLIDASKFLADMELKKKQGSLFS